MLASADERRPAGPRTGKRLYLAAEARALAQGIPDGLLLVDRRGRILFANDRLLAMTGYADADLVGAPVEGFDLGGGI